MKVLLTFLFLLFLTPVGSAALPTLVLKKVCEGRFHAPTEIVHSGDGSGRLFICDQPGQILLFQHGMLKPRPFLDLGSTGLNRVFFYDPQTSSPTSYSERGLLGLAFHPDFAQAGSPGYRRFYVNYTAVPATPTANSSTPQNCVTVISEFKVSEADPDRADLTSERILLTFGQPQSNHNGGQLAFGPDGYLYIGSGDGGGAYDNVAGHTGGSGGTTAGPVTGNLGNAQDKTKLLGKILRIDPLGSNAEGGQYGIPQDNPFASANGSEKKEIYAFGLRNPWRFSFDQPPAGSARLLCADVGQYDVEEINVITSGGNYGWRVKEGSVDVDTTAPNGGGPLLPPLAEYAHPNATLPGTAGMSKVGTSITGGYVYRGSGIPGLEGKYVFGDYAANGIGGGGGVLLVMEESQGGVVISQVAPLTPLPSAARIYTFGVDDTGEIYVGTKTTAGVMALSSGLPAGTLYKLVPAAEVQVQLPADRDNTLYESDVPRSNGKGAYLFAGKTGDKADFKVRRAAIRFDLSPIPADSVLTSASVRLHVNQQVAQDFAVTLHRLAADWGEGTSNAGNPGGAGALPTAGDVTWTHRFHNAIAWNTPGGDYVAQASATYVIGSQLSDPFPTWTGAGLVQDLQFWRSNPGTNFGWLLIGDETQIMSAQRFASREDASAGNRPHLTVGYAGPPPPTHFESWLAAYFPNEPAGFYLDGSQDLDHDGVSNLHEYAYGLNPRVADEDSGFTISTLPGSGSNTLHRLTFRRDSAATDLTYQLQTSPDLISWTTIASSIAGTSALGSNGGSIVSDVAQSGTIRLVTVQETLAAGVKSRRFVRLHVQRSF